LRSGAGCDSCGAGSTVIVAAVSEAAMRTGLLDPRPP